MCYSVMVENDLKLLEEHFSAFPVRSDFELYEQLIADNPKKFKDFKKHPRIYPNYWAPIIRIDADGKKTVSPMRYRIRPKYSEKEVPSKYNVFNARKDALENRQTWKGLFLKQHGVLVMRSFFEWVEDERTGKKKVIEFSPKNHSYMLVPVLWDEWTDGLGLTRIESFAVITTDPNPEVLAAGHDRSPIFIKKEHMDAWLNQTHPDKDKSYAILEDIEEEYYQHRDAVP